MACLRPAQPSAIVTTAGLPVGTSTSDNPPHRAETAGERHQSPRSTSRGSPPAARRAGTRQLASASAATPALVPT